METGRKKNFSSVTKIMVKNYSVLNVLSPTNIELGVVLYDNKPKSNQVKKIGRPLRSKKDKLLKKIKYVKFTKRQKEYMWKVFNIDRYPGDYVGVYIITKSLGYIGQYITLDKIKSWFSNRRFRA
jgi:hypothetical protein